MMQRLSTFALLAHLLAGSSALGAEAPPPLVAHVSGTPAVQISGTSPEVPDTSANQVSGTFPEVPDTSDDQASGTSPEVSGTSDDQVSGTSPEVSDTWLQWRGPGRDGRQPGVWPSSLDGLALLWRVELGKGYPGPLVAADRVFVVESLADESVQVRALGRERGEELWRTSWESSGKVPFYAAKNGDWVRSTPAYDGATLFVGDMREVLVALDGATGAKRWRVDFPARFGTPVPDFGFASSPLVSGGRLYLQAADSVLALDPATGETLWRALADERSIRSDGALSSPVLTTLAGTEQLVVQTREALHGLDPGTGRVLWSQPVPHTMGLNILTPAQHGDTLFTSSHSRASYLYRVRREGERFAVEQIWENKAKAYMSSPVVIDGHAYVHLGNGRLDCIDLATGESRWRTRSFGDYWSMIARGERILALDSEGELHLIQADPESFRLLASAEISQSPTWGHLAATGDLVVVRELEAVAAYRLR